MSVRYIAAGFRQDMEALFSRFMAKEDEHTIDDRTSGDETQSVVSLRFSRFCEIWREMCFSYVFRLRVNENELREFVDEIYLEVLPNVAEDHPLDRRVCALYLLYSLFQKQPKLSDKVRDRQKIRINFSYLEQIRDLIERCKRLEQLDVCYVWYKLLSLGAVHLVHVSRLMGPLYIRNSRVTNETQTKTDFLIDQFQTSLNQPFEELSHIHEKYRAMKEALYDESPQTKQLDQIQDNMFELSKAKMDNLAKEFTNTAVKTSVDNQMDGEEEDSDGVNQTYDPIGEKRRKLKEKAFGFGIKSKTEVMNETTVGHNLNESKTQTKIKRRGRPKVSKLTEIL
ncbi:unnamed protein product [Oppiella nova]|uniref:snRNA-activating protein complex subunit 1 n=1 Tax=Oppiella nova TaxID=334625 RepID=A0A7R9M4Y8_9ACAR|nr:unnamed protein product [Oppiella nova]CAG2169696.1 unnamed protein product [Oppiella nova]